MKQFLAYSLAIASAFSFFKTSETKAESLINGAGSTFIEPIANKWFAEYYSKNKKVKINYQPIGSGSGIRQLLAGTVDFAASDEPMKSEEEAKLKSPILHVPAVLGAVVVTYNLPVAQNLKLDAEVIHGLFTGEITKWNDSKLQKLNPGVTLPDTAVTVAYRSDSSGTTAVFTQYLSDAHLPFKTKIGQGKQVQWPVGVGAKGNAGVSGIVTQTPGSVGYVELTYAEANKMKVADIKNPSGTFVSPNAKSVSAAAAPSVAQMIKNNFKMNITNMKNKDAYPISAFSWFLVKKSWKDPKGAAFKDFLTWALSNEGQQMTSSLHYAPLPEPLAKAILSEVQKIEVQ